MSRRGVALLAGVAALGLCCGGEPAAPERPNIVLVVADDLAWSDHGFTGSPHVETPHLDRLARSGTVFTHAFNTASICRPSLRTLLTGLHPFQLEAFALRRAREGEPLRDVQRLAELVTLPRALGARGYASYQAGKYWEGDYRVAGFHDGMQQPGDDPAYGGTGRVLGRSGSLAPVEAFLDAQGEQPFFLWFAPMLPHRPHDATEDFSRRYKGRGFSWTAVAYYANVTRFDAVVGELLRMLDERGLSERTLVVYLVDNGWDQRPEVDLTEDFLDGPRGKNTLHEIGWRTPLVFSWPGRVPAGRVSDRLVSSVDLFPTLLEFAGAELPPGRMGHSLGGVIRGEADWPRRTVIGSQRGARLEPEAVGPEDRPRDRQVGYVLRSPDWWYVWRAAAGDEALYDIRSDPHAARDVAPDHPGILKEFRGEIEAWVARARATTPLLGRPNPAQGKATRAHPRKEAANRLPTRSEPKASEGR